MQAKRQIVNIVNFIRDIEPRVESITKEVLFDTVKEQIRLAEQYHLKTTFLLQYDAMIDPEYQSLLRALDPTQFEIGLWHEIVQPQCENLGISWKGCCPFDWHCHCGFPIGYDTQTRRALADHSFEVFRSVFGYYPRVFGSWFFDSETLRHITSRYGLDACCNCKEQYGTDGYTLWGGYYGQAYYPSSTNMFMPAQTKENMLDVPLFRMLGSDPVYQYDFGLSLHSGASDCQRVITLEPIYDPGGNSHAWVDWYMKENYNGECLSFGYAQAGQENSFTWERMKQGLQYQYALFARYQAEGKITVETMGETGRWFKKTFTDTPASAITAHSAFDDPNKYTLWYSSKYYRINLYCDGSLLRIRDFHLFCEDVPDPYENTVCTANHAIYETLPLVDGNLFSGDGVLSGVYFRSTEGEEIACESFHFCDMGNGHARVRMGLLLFDLKEDSVSISADADFVMENRIGKQDSSHLPQIEKLQTQDLLLTYRGTSYGLHLSEGYFTSASSIVSINGKVKITFQYGSSYFSEE